MRRWGQIPGYQPDEWYHDTAARVYRPDVYSEAARLLIAEGYATEADFPFDSDGYRAPTSDFIDGISYDGRAPNAYLGTLTIGLKGREAVAAHTPTGN